jgi:hypothetical protein
LATSRSIPADADTVFDILSDLGSLTWLPPGVEIELSGPRVLRLWIHDRELERPVRIDWARMRIEWGTSTTASYTGWIQVRPLAPNACAVSVRLTGLCQASREAVDVWIDEALEALVAEVRAERTRA